VSDKPFFTDVKNPARARPQTYRARRHHRRLLKPTAVPWLKILNEALATEIICVLRYKRHYFLATGINAESVATDFAGTPTKNKGTLS